MLNFFDSIVYWNKIIDLYNIKGDSMPEDIVFKNAASTASIIYVFNHKILLVQRDHKPFAGMWALPGGFLNCDQETLEDAALREFFEETNLSIKTPPKLFCVNSSPTRDPRGHVIDHVFILQDCYGIPKAKDDARDLKFFHLDALPELAFDHQEVVDRYCREIYKL